MIDDLNGTLDAADVPDKPVSTPEQNAAAEDKDAMLAWWLKKEAEWRLGQAS